MAVPIIRHARQIIYDNAKDIGAPVGDSDVRKAQKAVDVLADRLQAQVPDAPLAYAGKAGQFPRVNATEDALALGGISELDIIAAHDLVSFNNRCTYAAAGVVPGGVTAYATANTILIGQTVSQVELAWAYNHSDGNPHSQTLNQGIGVRPVADRSYVHAPTAHVANQTYTLTAEGDEFPTVNNITRSNTIAFRNLRYWGVHNAVLATDAAVRALVGTTFQQEFISARAVTKTFDASIGTPPNYLYFIYPTSFGLPAATYVGGFAFSDYTVTTIVAFDNGTGYTEDYYVIRTNPQYNGAGIVWQLT